MLSLCEFMKRLINSSYFFQLHIEQLLVEQPLDYVPQFW